METDIPSFPATLDLFAFTQTEQTLSGEVTLANLPGIAEVLASGTLAQHRPFKYSIIGRGSVRTDGAPGWKLSLYIKAALWLECQRCLTPYEQTFDIETHFRVVKTEKEADAAALEEDCDVIAGSTQFDLLHLLEEEILLALPIIPKHPDAHAECLPCDAVHTSSTPLEASSSIAVAKEADKDILAKNPFSILLSLKSSDPS